MTDTKLRKILSRVDKPSRYCGGELNTPKMKDDAELDFLLCFPDIYEVAMSNLGIKILYGILNNRPDTNCESAYAPWSDMAAVLREESEPLFSSETRRPMNEFDIIGFSMQYELSYTGMLYMLELGRVKLLSRERGEGDPIVMAGGLCVVNPLPLADFVDLFSIGDGENTLDELASLYVENKRLGGSRSDFLKKASLIDGVYVPSVGKNGVRRAVIPDLDSAYFPTAAQVPNIEAVHNRAVLEIFRGCTRGCRFCQAGFIYRPVRERSVDTIVKYSKELIDNCGFDEISLSSLSTCDYPDLRGLLKELKPLTDSRRVTIALPSTRVDSFEAEFVEQSRKGSLTFAPEAGTQRLRDVINKNVTEENIFTSMRNAFGKGYASVKLYFMIGLPTETDEDLLAIADLAGRIKQIYRECGSNKKRLTITVSASTFVPKPFTPFQWERQISREEIRHKQELLKSALGKIRVNFNYHNSDMSILEAAFARGDERLGAVLLSAYKKGCVFDSWGEFFDADKWKSAFDECGVSPEEFTREYSEDETLAWSFVDVGVDEEYFKKERAKSRAGETTPDCRGNCRLCGLQKSRKDAFKNSCALHSKRSLPGKC